MKSPPLKRLETIPSLYAFKNIKIACGSNRVYKNVAIWPLSKFRKRCAKADSSFFTHGFNAEYILQEGKYNLLTDYKLCFEDLRQRRCSYRDKC